MLCQNRTKNGIPVGDDCIGQRNNGSMRPWKHHFKAAGLGHKTPSRKAIYRFWQNDIWWLRWHDDVPGIDSLWWCKNIEQSWRWYLWGQGAHLPAWNIFYRVRDVLWDNRSAIITPRFLPGKVSQSSQGQVQGLQHNNLFAPFSENRIPWAGCLPWHWSYTDGMESARRVRVKMFRRFDSIKIWQPGFYPFYMGTTQWRSDSTLGLACNSLPARR